MIAYKPLNPIPKHLKIQMELKLHNLTLPVASFTQSRNRNKLRVNIGPPFPNCKSKTEIVSSALPETVASIAVAATVVGAAATLLSRRSSKTASQVTEAPLKTCDDCGGSGVCSECKGEGFLVKRLSDESAEKARLMAKNMATRYTAGLPKKWSYCTKCSSSRSCSTCNGSGKLSYIN